ncbi:MAG: hypothetical protein QM504_03435 [Pseudomonadota bacterium]
MKNVIYNISKRIQQSEGNVELTIYDKPIRTKLKSVSQNDVINRTYNAIVADKGYLEFSKNSDLSSIDNLKIDSIRDQLKEKGVVAPANFHYIIGANSILPNKLNNCSIEDGCYTSGVSNINNSVVYGKLYHGAANPYQSGTLLIRNSSVNSIHSITSGVVHLKNTSVNQVNARILKMRDSSIRGAYIESDLIMDGNNTVIDPIVNDRVIITRGHNTLAGHVVILGTEDGALKFDDGSNSLGAGDTNSLIVGDLNCKTVGFLSSGQEIHNKSALSINPLSVYDESTHVSEPGTVFKRISSIIDTQVFANTLESVNLQSLENIRSINSNLDNFRPEHKQDVDKSAPVDLTPYN